MTTQVRREFVPLQAFYCAYTERSLRTGQTREINTITTPAVDEVVEVEYPEATAQLLQLKEKCDETQVIYYMALSL